MLFFWDSEFCWDSVDGFFVLQAYKKVLWSVDASKSIDIYAINAPNDYHEIHQYNTNHGRSHARVNIWWPREFLFADFSLHFRYANMSVHEDDAAAQLAAAAPHGQCPQFFKLPNFRKASPTA